MKTQKSGKLSIQIDAISNRPQVIFQPANGTIWMNRNELCELFGVYMPVIDSCIDSIVKSKIFRIEDTCRYYLFVKNKQINFDIQEVNMEIIVVMTFNLDSPQAKVLREWVLEQLLNLQQLNFVFPNTGQNYLLN